MVRKTHYLSTAVATVNLNFCRHTVTWTSRYRGLKIISALKSALILVQVVAAIIGLTLTPLRGDSMDRDVIRANLTRHLTYLSVTLGDRSICRPGNLKAAEDYVSQNFAAMGYTPRRQGFTYMKEEVGNIIAGDENPGGYYILGAHFDTVAGTPGADDNASGVAVLLEVARLARRPAATPALGLYRLHLRGTPGLFHPGHGLPGLRHPGPPAKRQDFRHALPGDGGVLLPDPAQPVAASAP